MKIRGYLVIEDGCNGMDGFHFSTKKIDEWKDSKQYTFTIEVPHNFPELKIIEGLEEIK